MHVAKTTSGIDSILGPEREALNSIGLVPTMGALHRGHLEIVRRAIDENETVVVSIFVNPTQFNDKSDLDKYPRTWEADMEALGSISDEILVFAPTVDEMYSDGLGSNSYDFMGLDERMEGSYRPGHFEGVATIVEKLLLSVKPDRAYFGEKDYQQLQIIRSLVDQRGLGVQIIPCPIVREKNGLALSSRNARLSKRLKSEASFIYETLKSAKTKFGTESAASVTQWAENSIRAHEDFELEYFVIADAENLLPITQKRIGEKYRAFVAVYAEGVRLIDNVALN